VNNLIIENQENTSVNYHGMRFEGTIMPEDTVGAQFGSGYITLMCIPNDGIAIPTLLDKNNLIDFQSFIIAIEPYQTYAVGNALGATYVHKFSLAPGTSRTCSKGGKIIGQVSNSSPNPDMILTTLLSSFETTVK